MGKLEWARGLTKHVVVIQINPNKFLDYTIVWTHAMVTRATLYDVLVGGIILYLLGVTLDFWEETTHYWLRWQTWNSCKVFLPIFFIRDHARKSTKSIMLARFLGLPNGFDLLEGNIHGQDMALSSELEMLCVSGRLSIHASPLDPTPPWGTLSEL
jgi:hypothetical protein